MRFSRAVAVSLLIGTALAAVTPLHTIEKFDGETTGRFIIKLKDGVSKSKVLQQVAKAGNVTHDWQIINAFAAELDAETLNSLRDNANVESIVEDGIMHTTSVTQTNAPWGLSRISSKTKLTNPDTSALTYTYTYPSCAGSGVDIFVVDTGVLTTHAQFGGRARWGATFGGYASADGNGHGTHCAGIAAGTQFGVAKLANIVAVKVLSDAGSGSVADIVSGLNWVISSHASSGRPAVVSMSLGGSVSTALDNAITAVTNAGVHIAVAAGNSNTDAGSTSPARAPSAITVGASTIADARATFSNYGSVVDIFAPGQNIISAWIGSNTATNNISGTSMATPFVAGVIAVILSCRGNMTPAAMSTLLKSLASCPSGYLTGIPSGTSNCLLYLPPEL